MTLSKKIAAWVVMTLLILPCLVIMNNTPELYYVNILGVGYLWLLAKVAPRVLPRWMLDYINSSDIKDI